MDPALPAGPLLENLTLFKGIQMDFELVRNRVKTSISAVSDILLIHNQKRGRFLRIEDTLYCLRCGLNAVSRAERLIDFVHVRLHVGKPSQVLHLIRIQPPYDELLPSALSFFFEQIVFQL